METITFPVRGMTCSACVSRITRALRKVPGVERTVVDLRRETATVRRDPEVATDASLAAAVAGAGYEAHLPAARAGGFVERTGIVARLVRRLR